MAQGDDGVRVGTGPLGGYSAVIRQAAAAAEEARRDLAGDLDPMALGAQAQLVPAECRRVQEDAVDAFRVAAAVLEDTAASVRTTAGLYSATETRNSV